MRDMNDVQLEREQLMRDRGADRARRAQARAETAETPAGIQLAKRAVEPLTNAIRQFLAPSKGAGRRHTATKLLAGVDPELAAYVTVRVTLDHAKFRSSLHKTAMHLTEILEGEIVADRFETVNGALYRAIVRNAEARGLSPSRQMKAVALANRKFNVVERPWTMQQRAHVGTKLIELFIETIGIVRCYRLRTAAKREGHYLEFTPEIDAWMAEYNAAAALTKPLYLPTVVPPKEWDSTRGGAYHSPLIGGWGVSLVTKAFPGQMAALEEATKAGTMAPVYKGLNAIQATPWRINQRILAVMQAAWEQGLEGLPLPPREPMVKPEVPQAVRDAEKGSEVRRAWRRTMRDWHLRDQREKAHRFEFNRALLLAEEHVDYEAVYFPHRLDFRGRAYAAGTTLHPQGPDDCRALLEFAEGKPLGERGVFWLGVHGANLFGNDKVSLEDRFQWACKHGLEAERVAKDPLANRWWTEADKPWSFLAWCFEWAGARELDWQRLADDDAPCAKDYVSHMPIALDGTCNGLQHYAAMLRDEVGGRAVNLVPGDKPNDVYADVAGVVRNKLSDLMTVEGPEQWIYDRLFQLQIDRSITKRPVMVLPYGGTYKSCHEYTSQALAERIDMRETFGLDGFKATHALAKLVWSSIGDVVVKAREGMSWLQSLARARAKAGQAMQWVTPSGFVVVQAYRDHSGNRIKTRFAGSLIYLKDPTPGLNFDENRQALAVAPNFVHSLDASALMLTVGAGLDEGITSWAMIHDSYGTHAADTDRMATILREQFVRMYREHGVLAEFAASNPVKDAEAPAKSALTGTCSKLSGVGPSSAPSKVHEGILRQESARRAKRWSAHAPASARCS
jgi:DNA-directed RNA polymerase